MTDKVAGLLLVVPHALCGGKNPLMCDARASEVAKMISGRAHMNVEAIAVAYDSGSEVDMEKPSSRESKFRQSVTYRADEFCKKYGDFVLVIDIHSFDPEERPEWKDSEVVIAEGRTISDSLESVGLAHYLNKYGVKSKVVEVEGLDIQREMAGYKLPIIVIEFNESIRKDRLQMIADAVNTWIANPSIPLEGKGHHGSIGFGLGLGLLGGVALGAALAPRPSYHYYPDYYYYPPPPRYAYYGY